MLTSSSIYDPNTLLFYVEHITSSYLTDPMFIRLFKLIILTYK